MNNHHQAESRTESKGLNLDTSNLPLPRIIRFYDDFSDKNRIIRTADDAWEVITDGKTCNIDWLVFSLSERLFLKKFFSWGYGYLDPTSVIGQLAIMSAHPETISTWLKHFSSPDTAQLKWETLGYRQFNSMLSSFIRSISKFMCEMSLCGWSPDDLEFLKSWKWFAPQTSSAAEHGCGYYFIDGEERALINYFNSFSRQTKNKVDLDETRCAVLLYFCYQFGFRPLQIASLTQEDISVLEVDGSHIVHVTFYMAKQRQGAPNVPMLRRFKRQWSCILLRYMNLDAQFGAIRSKHLNPRSLFNLTPEQVSTRVRKLSREIIGRPITPGLFRHIAAQRMADLGMSQLALAEFLGHKNVDSCLVYYENSALQGQIVNAALGLSEIYQRVKKMTDKEFISKANLIELPEDQQVGGAAHGIPLAGIGGCEIGKNLCELSPAISCYTCPKFLLSKTHRFISKSLTISATLSPVL